MMRSTYYYGPLEDFLFKDLNLTSTWAIYVGAAVIGLIACLFEGYKRLECRLRKPEEVSLCKCNPCRCLTCICQTQQSESNCELVSFTAMDKKGRTEGYQNMLQRDYGATLGCPATKKRELADTAPKQISWARHFLVTLLHAGQVTTAYIIMLAVMSYSIPVSVAVVIGSGIGYAVFGLLK